MTLLSYLGAFLIGALLMLAFVAWKGIHGCRHDRIRSIYGDEIHAAGGMRSACRDCPALFPQLAETRDQEADPKCEGCEEPATTTDVEGIHLCGTCAAESAAGGNP